MKGRLYHIKYDTFNKKGRFLLQLRGVKPMTEMTIKLLMQNERKKFPIPYASC
jgi:hypothetical protein